MNRIFTFKEFTLNESSAAGNRNQIYTIPFKYSSSDPKSGYNSKKFVDDLKAIFIENPKIKKEIIKYLKNKGILKIEELEQKSFSFVYNLIPEIEKIITVGKYEPKIIMPGGGLLFIRNKIFKDGTSADFYINRKKTKIEVVYNDKKGNEKSIIYPLTEFPIDKYEFTKEEKEKLNSLLNEF